MLTSEEYVDNSGLICPVCKSENLSAEPPNGEGAVKVECLNCNATWTDVHTLEGYVNLTQGKPVTS